MEVWLRTDEYEESVSALEMLAESSSMILSDNYRWKWVLIALHNALQGFMVLALRQGNGLKVLNDKIADKWLNAHYKDGSYPVQKLDTFLNLYKKVKKIDQMQCFVDSQAFNASESHDKSVRKLNSFRNDFIHFVPKGWTLELTGLPRICLYCLDIIEFLGWQSGNILWHKEQYQKRAKVAFDQSVNNLEKAKTEYEKISN